MPGDGAAKVDEMGNRVMEYQTGEQALVLDKEGNGFCYYPSGRVAACISNGEKSYQKRYYFYQDNRRKTLLAACDERVVGFCQAESGNKLCLTKSGAMVSDECGTIKKSWKWDTNKQGAGTPPSEPLVFMLNNAMMFKFSDRKIIDVKFNLNGFAHEFDLGEKLARTTTYMENSQKNVAGYPKGKVFPNVDAPSLMVRQKQFTQDMASKRAKAKPKSNDFKKGNIAGMVADLENHFDKYKALHHRTVAYNEKGWKQQAREVTMSEIPWIAANDTEVGAEIPDSLCHYIRNDSDKAAYAREKDTVRAAESLRHQEFEEMKRTHRNAGKSSPWQNTSAGGASTMGAGGGGATTGGDDDGDFDSGDPNVDRLRESAHWGTGTINPRGVEPMMKPGQTVFRPDMMRGLQKRRGSALKDKKGQWLSHLDLSERLKQENPELERSAVLSGASGRYFFSRDQLATSNLVKMPGQPLELLDAYSFDSFIKSTAPDQLLVVACLRDGKQDNDSRKGEEALRRLQVLIDDGSLDPNGMRDGGSDGLGLGTSGLSAVARTQAYFDDPAKMKKRVKKEARLTGTNHNNTNFAIAKFEMSSSRFMMERFNVACVPFLLMFMNGQLVTASTLGGRGERHVPPTRNVALGPKMDVLPRLLLLQPVFKLQIPQERTLKSEHFQWDLAMNGDECLNFYKMMGELSSRAPVRGQNKRPPALTYGVVLVNHDDTPDEQIKAVERVAHGKNANRGGAASGSREIPTTCMVAMVTLIGKGIGVTRGVVDDDCLDRVLRPTVVANFDMAVTLPLKPTALHEAAERWHAKVVAKANARVSAARTLAPSSTAMPAATSDGAEGGETTAMSSTAPTGGGGSGKGGGGGGPGDASAGSNIAAEEEETHKGMTVASIARSMLAARGEGLRGRFLPPGYKFGLSLACEETRHNGVALRKENIDED
jgi:hypothetical protein